MIVIMVSLILIFIGNSLPLDGVLMMSLFGFLNFLLFCYVEYDRRSIFYLIPLDIIFYLLIVYKNLFNGIDIKYLIINIISFFILNYFYTSRKNKRKIDEA